jgi:hypothetical protein
MPTTVYSSGTSKIQTLSREFGTESVHVPGMRLEDQILLTPYITEGGSGPDRKGPLYCAFVQKKRRMASRSLYTTFRPGGST